MQKLKRTYSKDRKVLDVRWVASSFRTVSALWHDYESLCMHFESASKDARRSKRDQTTFLGLFRQLSSKQLLLDVAVMFDVLTEFKLLSKALQKRDITLVHADKLIRRCIRYLEWMKEHDVGEKVVKAKEAIAEMTFGSVTSSDIKKVSINHEQFLTSMVNTMKRRLLVGSASKHDDTCSRFISPTILSDLYVLEVGYWPFNSRPDFGRKEIKSLCERFGLSYFATMSAFGDFQDNGGRRVPTNLKPLTNDTKTFPCSSSECERGFSAI